VVSLILGIVSVIGIVFYPFVGGVGGLLTVIGTSIIICCQGNKPNGYVACAILCIIGGICHITGAGWLWYVYNQTRIISDSLDEMRITRDVADWASNLIIPIAVFQTVAFIFDMITVVLCFQARSDLLKNPPAAQAVEMVVTSKSPA